MSSYSITEPSARQKWIAAILVILYALITITPLVWIIATGFKTSCRFDLPIRPRSCSSPSSKVT